MDLSESLEFEFNRLIQNNPDLSEQERNKIISEGEKQQLNARDSVLFPFDKLKSLEGKYLGAAPDYHDGNLKVPVYKFIDTNQKIWLVPQYNQLKTGDGQIFKGFETEKPEEHIYKIVFGGEQKTEKGFYYKFDVYRRAL